MEQKGLYDPWYEHDACGVGFVVNVNGQRSHQVVEDGITILKNLAHRGAVGGDSKTGDGAGILMQLPHRLFAASAGSSVSRCRQREVTAWACSSFPLMRRKERPPLPSWNPLSRPKAARCSAGATCRSIPTRSKALPETPCRISPRYSSAIDSLAGERSRTPALRGAQGHGKRGP